jgi:hypothetical protein
MTPTVAQTIAAARRDLALALEAAGTAAAIEMMQAEVIATGGTWVDPSHAGGWGPHYFELSLHGISQSGDSAEEAIRHWASAVMKLEDYLAHEAEDAA